MCGLVGLFRTKNTTDRIDPRLLTQMRDTMVHRGPDDQGVYVSPGQEVGLAHRRLSIIDLSSAASQPMSNDDQSVWIVFNGEIYNHLEIREQLEHQGCRFKTDHSDTETLLRAYEQWGPDLLPKLRGMFAFAIWDKKKGTLWMARDRIGVKPLYYTHVNGLFLFASEIKALLVHPAVKRECHEQGFYDFLTFLVSPAPNTLFKGIHKLPASSTLTVHTDGRMNQSRYWTPFSGVSSFQNGNEDECAGKIIHSLRESIHYRMMSDVKFGVFLSGGIDSSTNVALMAELMNRPVETFSIGFENQTFNELDYARKIVDRYKTNHHEFILKPKDLIDFLPKLIHHQDEPIVDPVCVPVYYVSKLAKDNGTTVCQVGEGADELFCGYPYWAMVLKAQPWARRYQKIPSPLRSLAWRTLNRTLRNPSKGMRFLDVARRASFGESLFWGGAEAYQETHKKRFLNDSFLKRFNGYSSYQAIQSIHDEFLAEAPEGADDLHWMSYLDLRLRLPELLLMRVDKMTMATSVESRVPFLDHEFVQMAMGLPQHMKFKNKVLKYLLKKAVEPVLPYDNIYRRKQGFAVPVAQWFTDRLRTWADQKILAFAKRTPYFNPPVLESFIQGTTTKASWFLLNFVLWHESWIEKKELDLPV